MAAHSNVLANFKDKIRRNRHLADTETDILLMVLGIHRFCIDPSFSAQTGLNTTGCDEAYDIVVADNTEKIKCVLDPQLNNLIQKNQLKVGCSIMIKLSECSVHFNDLDISADSCVIIHWLSIVNSNTSMLDYTSFQFSTSSTDKEKTHVPLVTKRACYLPLWNSQDPVGPQWDRPADTVGQVDSSKTISIRKLCLQWTSLRKPYPPLLVKVINRGRLKSYHSPEKHEKWPFQLNLEVADASGSCLITVWSAMCLELWKSLSEGLVLFINNYTVRSILSDDARAVNSTPFRSEPGKDFHFMSRAKTRQKGLPSLDLEVNINVSRRGGKNAEIKVLDPTFVRCEWNMPDLTFELFKRKELSSLPDKYNCDVAGIVTYVGRYERLLYKKRGKHEFLLHRWIHMRDSSSQQPIRLLLYSTSQPLEHSSIRPGKILLCTQTRLMTNVRDLKSSRSKRHLYLTTSNESQIYVHSLYGTGPRPHPRIRLLAQWANSQVGTTELENEFAIAGFYDYPPLPSNLHDYLDKYEDKIELVKGNQLEETFGNSVCYREKKCVSLMGFILNVKYCQSKTRGRRNDAGTKQGKHKSKRQKTKDSCLDTKDPMECKVDDIWPEIADQLTVIGIPEPKPDFFPRECTTEQSEHVLGDYLAMPLHEFKSRKYASRVNIEDLPVKYCGDCLVVSVVGLNHQNVVRLLLPLPQIIPEGTQLEDVLSGSLEDLHSRDNSVTEQIRQQRLESVVQSATQFAQTKMLFIVNLYLASYDELEITCKRGFKLDNN